MKKLQAGDVATYRGTIESRRGQTVDVTHTGIMGMASVQFPDGWGCLVQPYNLFLVEDDQCNVVQLQQAA